MFPNRYFAKRYFPDRYFGDENDSGTPPPGEGTAMSGLSGMEVIGPPTRDPFSLGMDR